MYFTAIKQSHREDVLLPLSLQILSQQSLSSQFCSFLHHIEFLGLKADITVKL